MKNRKTVVKSPPFSEKALCRNGFLLCSAIEKRQISAVVNSRFKTNFSGLVNEYRIKEALHYMTDKRYSDLTIEEIGTAVGFANRQSFYSSFYRTMGETPNSYRKRQLTI